MHYVQMKMTPSDKYGHLPSLSSLLHTLAISYQTSSIRLLQAVKYRDAVPVPLFPSTLTGPRLTAHQSSSDLINEDLAQVR